MVRLVLLRSCGAQGVSVSGVGYFVRGIWEGEPGGGGHKMGWAWAIGRAEKNYGEKYAAYIISVRSPIKKEFGTTGRSLPPRSRGRYKPKAAKLHLCAGILVPLLAHHKRCVSGCVCGAKLGAWLPYLSNIRSTVRTKDMFGF